MLTSQLSAQSNLLVTVLVLTVTLILIQSKANNNTKLGYSVDLLTRSHGVMPCDTVYKASHV